MTRIQIAAALLLATIACDSPTSPPPDTTPPIVSIVQPVDGSSNYDSDGDGFADFVVSWTDDSGPGGIDVAGIRVRALEGVNGSAGANTNLLDVWTVTQRDSLALRFSERITNLLHSGLVRVEVSVPDTAGNVGVDTVRFRLPAAALLKTMRHGAGLASGLTMCPDDGLLYISAETSRLLRFDPDAVQVMSNISSRGGDEFPRPFCFSGDPVLYVTGEGLQRFDRSRLSWLSPIGDFGTYTATRSEVAPDTFFTTELAGYVGVTDRVSGERVRGFKIAGANFLNDVQILPSGSKLYVAGGPSRLLVLDPRSGVILKQPAVGAQIFRDLVVTRDGRWLFAAVQGNPSGLVRLNTNTDAIENTLATVGLPLGVVLSPSERRAFITVADPSDSPTPNVLIDLETWQIIAEIPRARAQGELRWDAGAAFHPNGKLIFVLHDLDLDVILHRE